MPTLLWRVLSSMGYPKGREPRYYWSREQLGDGTLVGIAVVVPTCGGAPPRVARCTSPEAAHLSRVPVGRLLQF